MLTVPNIRRYFQNAAAYSAAISNRRDGTSSEAEVRDIHALNPPPRPLPPPPVFRGYFSSSTSSQTQTSSGESFTSISREFNALVLAGSSMENNQQTRNVTHNDERRDLTRIGEERVEDGGDNDDHQEREEDGGDNGVHQEREEDGGDNGVHQEREEDGGDIGVHEQQVPEEETNPLAVSFSDSGPAQVSEDGSGQDSGRIGMSTTTSTPSVQTVRREEVEAKITAWQTAKVAKINNRFKREDAVINAWINEKIHKANSWMKKIEMKLEKKKAKATEKMQNNVAKAQRKAEEKRATAEAKRATEVAKVLEVANLMRTVGRPPPKRSFFSF